MRITINSYFQTTARRARKSLFLQGTYVNNIGDFGIGKLGPT